jgi:hypothetical protein
LLDGETRKQLTSVGLIAIIAVTLPITLTAALLLSVDANTVQAADPLQQTNNPETSQQQPSNKTDSELPNETVQPSSTNKGGPPAGSVIPSNVDIYTDSACTQPLTSIDWGSFSPGDSVNKIIYVKNTHSTPLTLKMSTTNWNPTYAAESITVTWNRENVILTSQQSTTATLTLTVASNISGISQFSVDIMITGF